MIAVLGSTGTLGTALRKTISNGKFHNRKDFDFENIEEAKRFLYSFLEGCIAVINAIAYTDVSKAEFEREKAFKINVELPRILSKVCESLNVKLLHISTDYVFGDDFGIYKESDVPKPKSWYGETKRISEEIVLERNGWVIRTSWIFGENGKNFFSNMPLKLLKNADIFAHDEQTVCPTPAKFLAENVLKVLSFPPGIYHITGQTPLTPLEGTLLIRDALNSNSRIILTKADLSIRPKVSILLSTRFKYEKPPFVQSVLEYLKTFRSQQPS